VDIAGLDIVGKVWQGWTMTDDLRTGVIWLLIDVVASRIKKVIIKFTLRTSTTEKSNQFIRKKYTKT